MVSEKAKTNLLTVVLDLSLPRIVTPLFTTQTTQITSRALLIIRNTTQPTSLEVPFAHLLALLS